jgi:HD-like signal output (HDOD) protein
MAAIRGDEWVAMAVSDGRGSIRTMAIKSAAVATKKRIGELLIEAEIISKEQLAEALRVQQSEGGKVVEVLINLGYLDTAKVAQFLSSQPGVPSIDLNNYHVEREVLQHVPKDFALQNELFPIDKMGKLLTVGMAFPLDSATIRKLEEMSGLRVKALLCRPEDIRNAIEQYYCHAPSTTLDGEAARISAGARVDSVAQLIRQMDGLPTLPQTVQQVQEASQSPETPLKEIAAIVSKDPALSATLLKLANSPAFGFTRRVDNVELATSLLGLHETRMAVISSAVIALTENAKTFDHAAFWRHSMICANAAKHIGSACGLKKNSGLFTAGLLCDIGRFALAECACARYAKIPAGLSDAELHAAEEKALGIGHAEAGYVLAEHWQLPPEIAEPIRFHLAPEHAGEHPEVAAVVALAARLTDALRVGLIDDAELLAGYEASLSRLNLSKEKVIKIYAGLQESTPKLPGSECDGGPEFAKSTGVAHR